MKSSVFVSFSRKIFILSPADFVISPVRNSLLGLIPENFLKFETFPGESSSSHWGTETGCSDRLRKKVFYRNFLKWTLLCDF